MIKYLPGIIVSAVLVINHSYAQNGVYRAGARSSGMSGASITVEDALSGFNNIGALASQDDLNAYFSTSVLYGIPGLLKMLAGLNAGVFSGVAAIHFFRFGDDVLSEHKLGIGYSHKIRFVSIGMQINYIQSRMKGYGTAGEMAIECGGMVFIDERIRFAMLVCLPLGAFVHPERMPIVPASLKAGVSFRPVKGLMINAEYQQRIFFKRSFFLGLEYQIRELIALRTGVDPSNIRATFGFGVRPGRWTIDYAIDYHFLLGSSHEFTLSIAFNR